MTNPSYLAIIQKEGTVCTPVNFAHASDLRKYLQKLFNVELDHSDDVYEFVDIFNAEMSRRCAELSVYSISGGEVINLKGGF